jgi:G3E family GTPase
MSNPVEGLVKVEKSQAPESLVLPRVRAVVLSGPLGSGKTTTLNQLLHVASHTEGLGNFVVIENDIGSANTDKQRLIVSPEQVLALTAGCICCNDLHSLKAAVKAISQNHSQERIDTIFIETTGIADPHAVKEALHEMKIPALLIVTVDVLHFERNRLLRRDRDMIAPADILAFTWWDYPGGEQVLTDVIKDVSAENPHAKKIFVDKKGVFQGESALNILRTDTADNSDISVLSADQRQMSRVVDLTYPLLKSITGQHKHSEFVSTITLKLGVTPDMVISEVTRAVPEGLIRVKGYCGEFSIDCTHGDWSITPTHAHRGKNSLTIIASTPIFLDQLTSLTEKTLEDEQSIDLSDRSIHDAATSLVRELIDQIPNDIVKDGRLVTECDAGEAWRYVSASQFPEDLRSLFLRRLSEFYLRQFEALHSGKFDQHPALPYYKREVGQNLSWLLIDCSSLLHEWGLKEAVVQCSPYKTYFEGLNEAASPLHVGSFRAKDIPYLKARLDGLATEIGSSHDAGNIAESAIINFEQYSIDGSWKKAKTVVTEYIRDN